jgi:hypothetical protein
MQRNHGEWIGGTSLAFAGGVWFGTLMYLLADTGWLPPLGHTPANLLILVISEVCVMFAIIGGSISWLTQESNTGSLAFFLGAIHLLCCGLGACGLRCGIIGPVWLD